MSQPEIPQFGTNPTHHGIYDNPFMLFFGELLYLRPFHFWCPNPRFMIMFPCKITRNIQKWVYRYTVYRYTSISGQIHEKSHIFHFHDCWLYLHHFFAGYQNINICGWIPTYVSLLFIFKYLPIIIWENRFLIWTWVGECLYMCIRWICIFDAKITTCLITTCLFVKSPCLMVVVLG